MSLLESLTNLFAPDDCLSCGREGSLLCNGCETNLPALIGRCYGCKRPIQGVACTTCLQSSHLDSLRAVTSYRGIAKLLVACLKFRGNQSAARVMAAQMIAIYRLPRADAVLVHMPATTAHVRERGYDQAQLLTRHLARSSGLARYDALRRIGNHHQLGASRAQRLQQLSLALSVAHPSRVAGKQVILIDDVLTTGSSLTAAARVLRQAGATRIDGLVFAQALLLTAKSSDK